MTALAAIVTRVDGTPQGHRVWVDYLGEAVPCAWRGAAPGKHDGPVPGDEVEIQRQADATYRAVRVLPRRGVVRLGRHGRSVAANIEQVVVVRAGRAAAARSPKAGAPVLLVCNKCDLEDESLVRSRLAPLVEDGLEVVLTSAVSGRGVEELRRRLEGRVSALVGDAGSGKTSLLEALYPGYGIREAAEELRPLPGGGYLAL